MIVMTLLHEYWTKERGVSLENTALPFSMAHLLSNVELALENGVDVLPGHVVCLVDLSGISAKMSKDLLKVIVGFVPPRIRYG